MGFPLNLMHLTLKATLHEHEFFGKCFFLHSSPCLETLTIQTVFAVSIISKDFLKTLTLALKVPNMIFPYFVCFIHRIMPPLPIPVEA